VSSNVFNAANLDASGFRCRRVFPVAPEDVSSFDIRNGTGNFVRLVRAGNTWKMSEPRESVASSERVNGFLASIARLEAQGFVWPTESTNKTSRLSDSLLAGYGLLEDSVAVVTLRYPDGSDRVVSFGSEAGNDRVYALVPDGSVVTVPSAARAAAISEMGAFVDSRLFPLEASAVGAVSIEYGGVGYLLSRNAEGAWRLDAPVSAPADGKVVEELVRRVVALKSSDMVADGVRVSIGTNSETVSVSRQSLFAGEKTEAPKYLTKCLPCHTERAAEQDSECLISKCEPL